MGQSLVQQFAPSAPAAPSANNSNHRMQWYSKAAGRPSLTLHAVLLPRQPAADTATEDQHHYQRYGITCTNAPMVAMQDADVAIDFTPAVSAHVEHAQQAGCAYVCGTTALTKNDHRAMNEASRLIPVLWAPNFSLGIAVLRSLGQQAAQSLAQWDVAISETHHQHKKDSPSGTALALGEAITSTTGHPIAPNQYSAIRGGTIAGQHTIHLLGEHEHITLTHQATDRQVFAIGALECATWLGQQEPGRYNIANVLQPDRAP